MFIVIIVVGDNIWVVGYDVVIFYFLDKGEMWEI